MKDCSKAKLNRGGKVPTQADIHWSKIDSFKGNSSSSTLLQWRPCPICESKRSRSILELSDFQFYSDSHDTPKRVDIRDVQCLDCSAVYMNPCYSQQGFQLLFAEAGQSYGASSGRAEEQIAWLSRRGLIKPGKRVLDVGCYDGRFLGHLPSEVHRVGVDVDLPAIERARRSFGASAEFFHADFNLFSYPGTLDIITMFHVLEHLPNPMEVLQNLRSLAHAHTRLVIEVPVLEEGCTNDICGFFSVQHLTHFSRSTLAKCIAVAGWSICDSEQQPGYNGYRIVATPSSGTLSACNDAQDTRLLYGYLSHWYSAAKDIEAKLLDVRGARIAIWGAGLHTEFLYQLTSFFRRQVEREYLMIDSDPMKVAKTWRGIPIHSPDSLRLIADLDFQLLISSYGNQEQIAKTAIELGVKANKIVKMYDKLRVY